MQDAEWFRVQGLGFVSQSKLKAWQKYHFSLHLCARILLLKVWCIVRTVSYPGAHARCWMVLGLGFRVCVTGKLKARQKHPIWVIILCAHLLLILKVWDIVRTVSYPGGYGQTLLATPNSVHWSKRLEACHDAGGRGKSLVFRWKSRKLWN